MPTHQQTMPMPLTCGMLDFRVRVLWSMSMASLSLTLDLGDCSGIARRTLRGNNFVR